MGPGLTYLSNPETTKYSSNGTASPYLRFGASSMQGWRRNMEDAHIAMLSFDDDPSAALFGIFDGHGGGDVAKFAELHFPDVLKENEEYKKKNYGIALKQSFLKIDELLDSSEGRKELSEMKKKRGTQKEKNELLVGDSEGPEHMGCTANVILIKDGSLFIANSGDSRSVLAVSKLAIELTIDHKPDNPKEKERIEKAGGSVIDGRVERNLNLSRSLGDLQYKKRKDLPPEAQMITADPEFHTQKISPTFDFIVMGCDGIYETMNSKEIVSFFYSEMEKNPEEKLSKHVENFLDKSLSPNFASTSGLGCDNMSWGMVRIL